MGTIDRLASHGLRLVFAHRRGPQARLGRSVARFNAFTVHASEYTAPQPCTVVGLHPTVVHFSAAATLFDHEWVTCPTDDSRGPTDKQIGRKLAALREVMGFEVEALAARSRLDVNLILTIEAGTHSANVDELSDLVFALGVTITAITRYGDPSTR
jgi:hypothetical protein